MPGVPRFLGRSLWLQAAILLLVCAAAFWPRLGEAGFASSEGHRVIPAWEMMEHGDWLVPHMFGQPYLRKPPGMPWAIAASSALFGQTEFAARAVSAASASAIALLAFAFATRWFGRPWGFYSGLAVALTPLLWISGRTAEIESLNALGTALAVFALADLLFAPSRREPRARAAIVALAAIGIVIAGLAKGPASAPCLVGVIAAACISARSLRPLKKPAFRWAIGLGGLCLVAFGILFASAASKAGPAVTQEISEFFWNSSNLTLRKFGLVLAMPFLAWWAGLPFSFALIFPIGPYSWSEAIQEGGGRPLRSFLIARTISVTAIISLLIYAALGMENPRHAMAAVAFTPVLAGYLARVAYFAPEVLRRRFARVLVLGTPLAWTAVMLALSVAYLLRGEAVYRPPSGREAGLALAPFLPGGAEVRANALVEARPEVLLYARQSAENAGRLVNVRWDVQPAERPALPPAGTYLALRTDPLGDEAGAYTRAGLAGRLEPVATGAVHKFTFTLFRVLPAPDPGS